jgi:hypothetical protein
MCRADAADQGERAWKELLPSGQPHQSFHQIASGVPSPMIVAGWTLPRGRLLTSLAVWTKACFSAVAQRYPVYTIFACELLLLFERAGCHLSFPRAARAALYLPLCSPIFLASARLLVCSVYFVNIARSASRLIDLLEMCCSLCAICQSVATLQRTDPRC